jgi:hypothetical protein
MYNSVNMITVEKHWINSNTVKTLLNKKITLRKSKKKSKKKNGFFVIK